MTLAPLVREDIRGVEGKPGEIGPKCSVPGCISLAQERHHIWPRSFLRGQPYEWVRVGDRLVQNATGLCIRHHRQVTGDVGGHRAHIRWNDALGILEWWELNDLGVEWNYKGALRGQKLVVTEAAQHRRVEGLCPTCGHVKREKKVGPKRKSKTWVVTAPDDSEKGAEVLNTYVEELAALMGFDESGRLARYHVLVPALEWISQNRIEFLADWQEASA